MFFSITDYNRNYKRQTKAEDVSLLWPRGNRETKNEAKKIGAKKKEAHEMDANKRQRYEKIAVELTKLVGGKENIQGVAHCATRLRIVLRDNDLADLKAMEDVDLAKGV